jgi:hypothetical protein
MFSASCASCDAKSSIPASLTDSFDEAANEAGTLAHKPHEAHEADLTPLASLEKIQQSINALLRNIT